MARLHCITASLSLLLLAVTLTSGQYSQGCTNALEDRPDPSSDSCQSFYRCYRRRQYSLRCPLGQVFDFDRSRCRPTNSVNCQLQLQRFQAPAVPSYMWPNQRAPQDGEVEIRVVHVGPDGVADLPGQNTQQSVSADSNQPRLARASSTQPSRPSSNGNTADRSHSSGATRGSRARQGQGQNQGQDQNQGQGQYQGQGQTQGQGPNRGQGQNKDHGKGLQANIPDFLSGASPISP